MVCCGPAMWAMRVWPSAARWSTAIAEPRRSSGTTAKTPSPSMVRFTSTTASSDAIASATTGWRRSAVAITKPSTWRAISASSRCRSRAGSPSVDATRAV